MERITGFEAGSLPKTPAQEMPLTQNMPFVVGGETLPPEFPKLADLPEFAGIKDPDQMLARDLLACGAMIGFSLEQKRMFLIYYAWETADSDADVQNPLGTSASEKLDIIDRLTADYEVRYGRFSDLISLVKRMRMIRKPDLNLNEMDLWVLQTLASLPELEQELLEHLPEEFRQDGLTDEAYRTRLLESIQKAKATGILDQGKKKEKKPGVEKPKSKKQVIRDVFKRIGRVPAIRDFDIWVYERWVISGEWAENLIHDIPGEFNLSNLSEEQKLKRIYDSAQKLRRYGVIRSNFKDRRIALRREKIKGIIQSNGKVPSLDFLSEQLQVSESVIVSDLAALRRRNSAPASRKLSLSRKNEIARKIARAVAELEVDGRSYQAGDILPSEIARHIGLETRFVINFISRNRELTRLPERKHTPNGRASLRALSKQAVRQAIEQTSDYSPSNLHEKVKSIYPDFPYTTSMVKKLRNEIKREESAKSKEVEN